MDLTIPLAGLNHASEKLDSAASRIARAPLSTEDPPRDVIELSPAMVSMLEARNDYIANLRAAKTMDETDQTLLDSAEPLSQVAAQKDIPGQDQRE